LAPFFQKIKIVVDLVKDQVTDVSPFLFHFKPTFTCASYLPIPERSSRLFGLAPVGWSGRFIVPFNSKLCGL